MDRFKWWGIFALVWTVFTALAVVVGALLSATGGFSFMIGMVAGIAAFYVGQPLADKVAWNGSPFNFYKN